MKTPLVSVIMPAYNCENYVEQALESLLRQTYTNLEIIIVDDCSTDNTWGVIQSVAKKDSRIKAYQNKVNSHIVKTLNFAIEKTSGEYLARMDSDDERLPDSIALQVEYLEKHPDVVVVGGFSELCDEHMNVLNLREYPTEDAQIRKKIFRFSPFTHACIVMRKSAIPSPAYDVNFDCAEDYNLYFNLAKKGKLANIPTVVYKIRTHKKSISRTRARHQENLTLYIRLKAVFEYGYTMQKTDKIYFACQLLTMYLMSPSFRFWLFNKIRTVMK